MKQTILLTDDPATVDEFGPHSRIADLISEDISRDDEGRSIALVGEWGSGKTTVIRQLTAKLPKTVRLFTYDAWSHQGDPLRRAFLDDLLSAFKADLSRTDEDRIRKRIWNRTEETKTTTEPLLRRHAKVLLFAFALIPLGLKFLNLDGSTDATIGKDLISYRNILGELLLVFPVLLFFFFAAANLWCSKKVRTALFGESANDPNFSVLSFLVQTTRGSVERKEIKSPTDSIEEFKAAFRDFLISAEKRNPDLKIVIVVDNIDRIPSTEARAFWSTMQTFFNEAGGSTRERLPRKYWLIAPFSIQALSFVFRDENDMPETGETLISKAEAYIDKTFAISYFVPPPILANWRKYLLAKLRSAFPEHDESDLANVRDLFDLVKSGRKQITPREMKLFVNSLAVAYRQRGDDIPLPAIAAYLLHRKDVVGSNIPDTLLSPGEQRAVEYTTNWRTLIAALHFGVAVEEANQILLQEPILAALRDGAPSRLHEEEKRPGFDDVLQKVLRALLEDQDADDGERVARFAATIGGLERASEPSLSGVWSVLKSHLRTATGWGGFKKSPKEGIEAVIFHSPQQEKSRLCSQIAKSVSVAHILESDTISPIGLEAKNWVETALALAAHSSEKVQIGFPGTDNFRVGILNVLATVEAPRTANLSIDVQSSTEGITSTIASQIRSGKYPRTPEELVLVVHNRLKFAVSWKDICEASVERLKVTDVSAFEIPYLLRLLLSVGRVTDVDGVEYIATLSTQGHLSNLMHVQQDKLEPKAALIAATLIANPKFKRPEQVANSQTGDTIYTAYLAAPDESSDLAQEVAAFLSLTKHVEQVFEQAVELPKTAAAAVRLVQIAVEAGYTPDISPDFCAANLNFFEEHFTTENLAQFVSHLKAPDKFAAEFVKSPFDVQLAWFAQAALESKEAGADQQFLTMLGKSISAMEFRLFEQAISSQESPYEYIVPLCSRLRSLSADFNLGLTTRDAVLNYIRGVARGEISPTDNGKAAVGDLIGMVSLPLRKSLLTDLIEDMCSYTEPEQIERTIELSEKYLTATMIADPSHVVRRVFPQLINTLSTTGIRWISNVVSDRQFNDRLQQDAKVELSLRLQAALEREGLADGLRSYLSEIANALDIDLPTIDTNTNDNAAG